MKETVTVIIPAYNEEQYLERTIRSLHTQTYPANEIIVIDDYSTDATGKIALKMGVKVLKPPQNTGSKAKAQNYALPYVNTDLIVALDADTALQENALEELVKAIENPELFKSIETLRNNLLKAIDEIVVELNDFYNTN